MHSTLTFDSAGVPTIAYSAGYTSGLLKLARRIGGTWTFEDVTTESGDVVSTGAQFADGATAPTVSYCLATVGSGGTRTLKLATPAP